MFAKQKEVLKAGIKSKSIGLVSYGLLIGSALIITGVTSFLYLYTQNLLSDRLHERMIAIASTASYLFDAKEINSLLEMGGEESVKTPLYKATVNKLREIKEANPDVTFAYIYGKTDDPNSVVFIADADVIALRPDLNFNEDEVTEEGFPGSKFDISDIPLLTDGIAFNEVVVDDFFYETIWGRLMTTYAPIKIGNSESKAVLGVDVDISDFNRLVKATFVPFGLFVVLLLVLLSILTLTLLKMWKAKVDLVVDLDKQKDELLSIVSHQLATPVSSMSWYLEMMLDGDFGKLSPEMQENTKSLQSTAANLSDLVHMILDVSRLQLGKMKVDRTDLNLNEFFGEILEMIQAKVLERKVKLTVHLPKDLPVAYLDKRLMRMTFENLLSNAVKYSKDVGGEVELNVEVKNDKLSYSVKDNGRGIPKEEQSKIFGKLFRASNVQQVDGNGFGLYAAKGAVEAQGGKISFTSIEGKGTNFIVEIPLNSTKESKI